MLHAAWVIPAFPLAGFALLVLFGHPLGDPKAGWLATVAAVGSFVASVVVFAGLLARDAANRTFVQVLWNWIPVAGLKVDVALRVDPLSMTMALFVTGVGSLIHLYSIAYMKGDARYHQFFIYLNLFLFSMLMLVLGDNFLVMFLGWEGVGTCSYLLISFWFERERAASAGKKAFVTNRVGDWGFLMAMFLLFAHIGSLNFGDVLSNAGVGHLSQSTATVVCLAFLLGAVGKSAQLPLYIWLPDAMEGPTPVSALIHAATMVTAGVYLLCRISPILHQAPDATLVVAWLGALTALFAATIACGQDDIKRVLAYSTISQLGYMVLAAGTANYVGSMFHMVTHAFFKALLFLGAGAVIHGLHEQQDMKHMGNLRKWMPVTAGTFAVAWLAISGIPPLSGFWSKDDILAGVWVYHGDVGKVLWVIGVVTAGLTAYYMSRQVALVFYGEDRWRGAADAAHDPHESEAHAGTDRSPHEAPWQMLVPLVVLAVLSFAGGLVNLPWEPLNFLEKWLAPVVGPYSSTLHLSTEGKVLAAVAVTAVCLVGLWLGFSVWVRSPAHDGLEPVVLKRAWYVDWAFSKVVGEGGLAASEAVSDDFDIGVVDGAVNGVGVVVRAGGAQLRRLQTGYVRNYALGIAAGTVAVMAYVLVRAS